MSKINKKKRSTRFRVIKISPPPPKRIYITIWIKVLIKFLKKTLLNIKFMKQFLISYQVFKFPFFHTNNDAKGVLSFPKDLFCNVCNVNKTEILPLLLRLNLKFNNPMIFSTKQFANSSRSNFKMPLNRALFTNTTQKRKGTLKVCAIFLYFSTQSEDFNYSEQTTR